MSIVDSRGVGVGILVVIVGMFAVSCTNSDEQSATPSSVSTTTVEAESPDGVAPPPTVEQTMADAQSTPATNAIPESSATIDPNNPPAEGENYNRVDPYEGTDKEPPAPGSGIPGASQSPDLAESCAMAEFGYLALLDGDAGDAHHQRLAESAAIAMASEDSRYVEAGTALSQAEGTDGVQAAADGLLSVCADDGYERLT